MHRKAGTAAGSANRSSEGHRQRAAARLMPTEPGEGRRAVAPLIAPETWGASIARGPRICLLAVSLGCAIFAHTLKQQGGAFPARDPGVEQNMSKEGSESARDGGTAGRVRYARVDESEANFPSRRRRIRYAAYEPALPDRNNERDGVAPAKTEGGEADGTGWVPLSVRRWAQLLAKGDEVSDAVARDFARLIKSSPYEALYFETRPVSPDTAPLKQFEFVLVDAPELKRFCESSGPDESAFEEHLACLPKSATCCAFSNLGGDAHLVAPRKTAGTYVRAYSHLGAFVRFAKDGEICQIWQATAREYLDIIENSERGRNVWLSTSGTGVAWLHLRMDSRPKYYQYTPFKEERDVLN